MNKKVFKCKDFRIASVYVGSRLQNGPQWGYEIWYHSPGGKSLRVKGIYHTKAEARKQIRKIVAAANMILAKKTDSNQ